VTKSHPFFQAADWEFHGEKFNIFPAGGGYQSCQQLVNNVIMNKVINAYDKVIKYDKTNHCKNGV
jgi:hypothetical protein